MSSVILDNIIFELQEAGGISAYWAELGRRHEPDHVEYFGRDNSNLFAKGVLSEPKDEIYPNFIPRRYLSFRPNFGLGLTGKHIFHSSYYRCSRQPEAINVTTVHDFTYEFYSRGLRRLVHGLQKKRAVSKSSGIICVSENTKKDLLDFYPWVDELNIRVIYNGVGAEFSPNANSKRELEEDLGFRVRRPFLLFVGDRSSYKRFDVFIDVAHLFPAFDFVVVGGSVFNESELKALSRIMSRVTHLRGISSKHLNLLYNEAYCLVYPSLYEGFGIPVLEAMKAGCPVVSTNLSSIPEVAGGAALLVDVVEVGLVAEEIARLSDCAFRQTLTEKGLEQSSRFSWDKCFNETCAFYKELLDRS